MNIKQVFLIILSFLVSTPLVLADSPKLKLRYSKHFYQRFDRSQRWFDATNSCKNLGDNVHLATVSSLEENVFLAQLTDKQLSWLGGSLTKTQNTVWVNGDIYQVQYMDRNSGSGDHFIITGNATWLRGDDKELLPYICEWD